MPWRLISFLLALGIITVFIGFNLDNVSDISFGFTILSDVPIFISLLVAFLTGALVMLPAAIGRGGSGHIAEGKSSKTKALPKKTKKAEVGDGKNADGSDSGSNPNTSEPKAESAGESGERKKRRFF